MGERKKESKNKIIFSIEIIFILAEIDDTFTSQPRFLMYCFPVLFLYFYVFIIQNYLFMILDILTFTLSNIWVQKFILFEKPVLMVCAAKPTIFLEDTLLVAESQLQWSWLTSLWKTVNCFRQNTSLCRQYNKLFTKPSTFCFWIFLTLFWILLLQCGRRCSFI